MVSRGQLLALGVDDDRIYRLAAQGWLTRVHRAVYRVGALTADGGLWLRSWWGEPARR